MTEWEKKQIKFYGEEICDLVCKKDCEKCETALYFVKYLKKEIETVKEVLND